MCHMELAERVAVERHSLPGLRVSQTQSQWRATMSPASTAAPSVAGTTDAGPRTSSLPVQWSGRSRTYRGRLRESEQGDALLAAAHLDHGYSVVRGSTRPA